MEDDYEVECTINGIDCMIVLSATSGIDALDKMKTMFGNMAHLSLTDSANKEMFEELGVSYD